MQFSIAKLTSTLIALLIAVSIVTSAFGLYVVEANYRTLENKHEIEARDTVRNASIAIRNQIRFYQGVLQLIATNQEVSNLLEFADAPEIFNWSRTIGRLLPGTLGTALAGPDGIVFGDPLALHVGPICQADMKSYTNGAAIHYPLLHTQIPGLEHFDLLSKVRLGDDEPAGTLFVSFRLDALREVLEGITLDGDRFALLDHNGAEQIITGSNAADALLGSYSIDVPGTSWKLKLQRPKPASGSMIPQLIAVDALILLAAAGLIIMLVRKTMNRFKIDLRRIHDALSAVLAGEYRPSHTPTAIKETMALLPDIEHVAMKLQQQRDELRHQSLSDPLTGVFNRRYFDLMLGHLHEQSHRQDPATLVILDLNDFKDINDQYGHSIGDQVLQNVAQFLRERIRATDIVARLGGDEFALILTHMVDNMLQDWLNSLITDYDRKTLIRSEGEAIHRGFSIGAATIDARVCVTPADVFKSADQAMYSIKRKGDSQHSRFAIARVDNITAFSARRELP